MKIQCDNCGKLFAATLEKLRRVAACPKCGQQGYWWTSIEPNAQLHPPGETGESAPSGPMPAQGPARSDSMVPVGEVPRFERLKGPANNVQMGHVPSYWQHMELQELRARVEDGEERNQRILLAIIAFLFCGPVGLLVLLSDSRRPTNWLLVFVVLAFFALIGLGIYFWLKSSYPTTI